MSESLTGEELNYPGNLMVGIFHNIAQDMKRGHRKTREWVLSEDFVLWCEAWDGIDLNAEFLRSHLLTQWQEPVVHLRRGGRPRKTPVT